MENKVIIITGGGSGIGQKTALKFAREGARVVVADSDEAVGIETVDLITREKGQSVFIKTDVTSYNDIMKMVDFAVEVYGRIDFMFNNAGIAEMRSLLDHNPEIYDRVVQVNQYGVYYGILVAARKMKELGIRGVIINMASVYAFLATKGPFGYHASKAAVKMMTQCAALELAEHGIRVIAVAPGYVDTPIIKEGKKSNKAGLISKHMGDELIEPEAIADAVFLLCSDDAKVINGSTVMLDDGYAQFK